MNLNHPLCLNNRLHTNTKDTQKIAIKEHGRTLLR